MLNWHYNKVVNVGNWMLMVNFWTHQFGLGFHFDTALGFHIIVHILFLDIECYWASRETRKEEKESSQRILANVKRLIQKESSDGK
jgi:hypothetical protein